MAAVEHNRFMALRHRENKKKEFRVCVCFFFFFQALWRKESTVTAKKYIKTKDKTVMQYQINFRRRLSFTKKRLESALVESEKQLGLYKECLSKNIPLQVTSISGRII